MRRKGCLWQGTAPHPPTPLKANPAPKVRVVQHKQTKDLYALKYINKAKCVKMKAVANIIQERRLLEEIDHPFVVNMRYAFQDDENCFFVLDLMLGGDLRCTPFLVITFIPLT